MDFPKRTPASLFYGDCHRRRGQKVCAPSQDQKGKLVMNLLVSHSILDIGNGIACDAGG